MEDLTKRSAKERRRKKALPGAPVESTATKEEKHDADGGEIMDSRPMQPPLGYRKTPSLAEQIQMQVRRMKLELLEEDAISETEEEADDFEVGDDFEPLSPYENDHVPSIRVLKQRAHEINEQIKEENRKLAVRAHQKALGIDTGVPGPVPDKTGDPPASPQGGGDKTSE